MQENCPDGGSHYRAISGSDAFSEKLQLLRSEILSQLSKADFEHLRRIEFRGRLCSALGYASLWCIPNPITAFLLSFGQFTRWLLAHHILHRGYDRVPGIPKRYTSKYFAAGWRRLIDWFDWIHPLAWHHEHNLLHHYYTGEDSDPDLVERHIHFLQKKYIPKPLRYILVLLASVTWKATYYAPNTISVFDPDSVKKAKNGNIFFITIKSIFDLRLKSVRRLWLKCYLPYGGFHFVIIPLLFLPFGETIFFYALGNKLLAEAITNFHSFLIIGPNHTGSDLCRYDFHYRDKSEFLITQILGTANYHTGGDLRDHLQIWLNYQIEHHIFPDLPMLQYQKIQPRIKALCLEHNIPYLQESVFVRFRKMLDVCVGNATMRPVPSFEEVGAKL